METVKCLCGCGEVINKYDKKRRLKFYVLGHFMKGKRLSVPTKQKISQTNKLKGILPPSRKGIKMTEEQKQKLRDLPKRYGFKPRPETIRKLRENSIRLGLRPPTRANCEPWNKGIKGFRAGQNSHLWRGGITGLNTAIRGCFEYRQWRSDVFKRDDFTCVLCMNRGGKLNVDHIKSFKSIMQRNNIKSMEEAVECSELWDINNGRTLCVDCHKKTPNYGIKGRHDV